MLKALAILATGVALGLGSAATAISQFGFGSAVQIGPWKSPIDAGGAGRGAYLRAAAALRATLALSRQEAIYFRATSDSLGRPLQGACTYSVHGPNLPARWWSVTLYGADHYLIANPGNHYAIASVNATHAADGSFTITISPTPHPGDWLDTANTPNIVLLTRLYEPHADAAAVPAKIAMPSIDRQACP